jgi:hypothetical protein
MSSMQFQRLIHPNNKRGRPHPVNGLSIFDRAWEWRLGCRNTTFYNAKERAGHSVEKGTNGCFEAKIGVCRLRLVLDTNVESNCVYQAIVCFDGGGLRVTRNARSFECLLF